MIATQPTNAHMMQDAMMLKIARERNESVRSEIAMGIEDVANN